MGALIINEAIAVDYAVLKALRKNYERLQLDLEEAQAVIESFNTLYYNRFSLLLYQILLLRKEQGDYGVEAAIHTLEEAKKEKPFVPKYRLKAEEKEELKKLFRDTAKKIHPDTVRELSKDEAKELMQKLNTAYKNNDLQTVRIISQSWASGYRGESKEELKEQIEDIKVAIADLEVLIGYVKSSEEYKNAQKVELSGEEWWAEEEQKLQKSLLSLSGGGGK